MKNRIVRQSLKQKNHSASKASEICSDGLNSRSIVFSGDDEIVIEIGAHRAGQCEEAAISFDGADVIPLHTGDRVRIKKAWETAKIVKLSKISFLETMREKMKGN